MKLVNDIHRRTGAKHRIFSHIQNMLTRTHHLRGVCCVDTRSIYVEILRFKHFTRHMVFTENGKKPRNKEIKNYINVSVAVEVVCGDTKK